MNKETETENKSCKRFSGIGGQAVMEGIMMRNNDKYAVAVRKQDGEIEVKVEDYKGVFRNKRLQKIPFVRGIFNFIDSMVVGISCLMYSASFFEEEEEEPPKKEKKSRKEKDSGKEKGSGEEKDSDTLFIAGTMILAFALAVFLFMVLPLFVTRTIGANLPRLGKSALESGIRVAVFIGYMVAISKMKDIQRTYEYHGAEHKCINCIENGLDLNVENVMKSSRQHKRCGTSFLFFVIIVSVIFQMFIYSDNKVTQVVVRLLLIPVIAGISYEIIRLAGISDNPIVNLLSKPGLALQKLTTREPDEQEAEVAICAVEAVFDWRAFLYGEDAANKADTDGSAEAKADTAAVQ